MTQPTPPPRCRYCKVAIFFDAGVWFAVDTDGSQYMRYDGQQTQHEPERRVSGERRKFGKEGTVEWFFIHKADCRAPDYGPCTCNLRKLNRRISDRRKAGKL